MTIADQELMNKTWKMRNELYQELFGQHKYSLPKAYEPPAIVSRESFEPGAEEPDIQTLLARAMTPVAEGHNISILAYEPTQASPYWMYVTSGLSNPWHGGLPGEVAGFGCELIIKANKDARWPFRMLRRLAGYILSYAGTASPGVILSMQEGVFARPNCQLSELLVWYADEAPDCWYELPAGGFGLFTIIGITEDEAVFAESSNNYGTWCIQQVLRHAGVGQITDPDRASVMKREDIGSILQSVRTYAEMFAERFPEN